MTFVGEIRIFAGNFAPAGWMFCEGQLLPISENETLFNLIGTTYGGDGQATFALPDLRGRIPLHFGNSFSLADTGGQESVTLTTQQIPAHSHALLGSSNFSSTASPQNNLPSALNVVNIDPYGTDQPTQAVSPQSVSAVGGSQPHENLMPFLCLDYIISLFGIFPHP